jgi:hypothetical protein
MKPYFKNLLIICLVIHSGCYRQSEKAKVYISDLSSSNQQTEKKIFNGSIFLVMYIQTLTRIFAP